MKRSFFLFIVRWRASLALIFVQNLLQKRLPTFTLCHCRRVPLQRASRDFRSIAPLWFYRLIKKAKLYDFFFLVRTRKIFALSWNREDSSCSSTSITLYWFVQLERGRMGLHDESTWPFQWQGSEIISTKYYTKSSLQNDSNSGYMRSI